MFFAKEFHSFIKEFESSICKLYRLISNSQSIVSLLFLKIYE